MLIGISGKSGSGKSTLARRINESIPNSVVVSVDDISHGVLKDKDILEEIKETFGNSVIEEGNVNRKLLGDIVFASRYQMDKLTSITWRAMQIVIDQIIAENKDKVIILDWLLLPHTKYFSMCDLKIMVDVDFETRMKRALLRDGISEEKFRLRDSASIDLNHNDFDVVIEDVLESDVRKLVKL